jgi:hypothetical protein
MKTFLYHFNFFLFVLVLLAFSGNVNGQCSITGVSPDAGTYSPNPCTLLSGCGGVLYIGDGVNPTNLIMSTALNLTCLGSIQLIIKNNASIDFSSGNDYLTLATGSSIYFEGSGTLVGGSCNASERIYIGTELIASCNGNAGADYSFPQLVGQGGYNIVNATISPNAVCGSGSFVITATPIPSTGATIKWYTVSSGGSSISTTNPYTTPTISTNTTYYVEAYYSSTGFTTPRKAVVSTVNPLPTITGNLSVCAGSTTTLTGSATANATTPWTSATTAVATVSSSGVVTGVSGGTSVITYMNNNGCTKTATVTVASLVNNVASGFSSSSFCAGNQATITFDANNGSGVYPYTLVYRNDTTLGTASVTIANDNPTAFNVFPNPTATTDYTLLSITDFNGCVRTSGFVDSTARVTINALPNAPVVGAITHPTCALAIGSVVLSGLPASGTWTLTRTGTSSATTTGTGTSTTISGLAAGTYNFTVTDASGCTSLASANVVINAQPATPTVPTVSITQPICTLSTGTLTVTVQNIGETYSFDNGSTFQAGNSKSGLAAGSYNVIIKSTGGCNSPATNVTIKSDTNIWSGSVWSNGTTPISTENIVFNGAYTLSSNLVGCSCQVNNSVAVAVNSGYTLTITNGLTVVGSGSLTFEDTASLVQINTSSNSGNIKYKRLTTVIRNTDYTYWSSPVSGFTLGGVSPNTSVGKFYSFDSAIDDWKQESAATAMVSGIGYIIRGPQTSAYLPPNPPSLYQATFTGVPNNGHYEITGVIADRSYLLGNPYPSALDADTFLDANQNVLDGTLYFWTHNTPIAIGAPNPGTGLYAYSGDDYASYNRTGGVATAAAPSASTGGLNSNIPSGKIASGQGFFGGSKVSLPSSPKIIFDNNMRVGVGGIIGDNTQFFKTKNIKEKTATVLEKHLIWLDLTNTQGAFKQTLIGYVSNATNDYESRFDGESYDGNNFLDFYSVLQNKNLAIQGRALPFDENDEVPLGFRIAVSGTFTIKIGQTDGLLSNETVFLEDKLFQTVINLKTRDYTFNTDAGTFDNRFVLRYTDKTLGIDKVTNDGMTVLYSNNYRTLIIRNDVKDTTVNSVTLYNMLGQKIAFWDVKGREQTNIQIPIKNLSSEIYIVKIKTTKGEFSKKIIIR